MARSLKLTIGQHSEKGRKEVNQDFHGVLLPEEPLLSLKGVAIALADGISTSEVSRVAAESSVKSFLTDYYCTSDSWSVKTSATRVIASINSWLHSQTLHGRNPYDKDKGYVCALSVMVVKSATAHLFHVGDARIYRLVGQSLEQLTEDHRVILSSAESYLGRALGMSPQVEIDYRAVPLTAGDVFMLATDGIYEHVGARFIAKAIADHPEDFDAAARAIAAEALEQGSGDNLTVQIVRIDELPPGDAAEVMGRADQLPPPPLLEPRQQIDGYRVVRQLHASARSHIYLVEDGETGQLVALKIPSLELRGDTNYLKRFMMEEWVARRLDSAHVLKASPQSRRRTFLYIVTEYVDGQTLAQWMIDNPRPHVEIVRDIIEQIAKGLRAFHRKEMVHQDLRPANVMIDRTGTVKIIDFGSTKVTGVLEAAPDIDGAEILGTAQYTAPEYYLGEGGSSVSDIYSLGTIAYHMLTGRLPYGTKVAGARSRAQQRRLTYVSALDEERDIPAWVDGALERAVAVDPAKRYDTLSEFLHDLRHPNRRYLSENRPPLLERNPVAFWQGTTAILAAILLWILLSPYLFHR